MQAQIRPIQQKDDAEVGQLIRAVLTEFKANKPGTAYYDESTSHLSKLFVNNKAAYWVIEANNKIVGCGGIFPTEGLPDQTCELVKLYLYPEARGKGLGRDLMFKCFDQAKEFGYQNIYLESMPELNQAVSLYEKIGFEHLDCSLGNSGHFGCDIWMVRKL